ncbi:unnamed protein product [Dracunculus medinensis]|uniref:Uncharacterized protein n=1 Tax=Dracunculus medinensis TaxID=318479 RepID=A0A3P7R2F1_DRAME|nr:unnamed protein product [Dracunculus medinensis]
MIITGVYAEDSGIYRCVARNNIGSAESECFISIREKKKIDLEDAGDKAPKFRMPLSDREIAENSELSLVCAVTGTPNPTVKWLKNDESENGVCTLIIRTTKLRDAGNYKCIAENRYGSVESICKVAVHPQDAIYIVPKFKEALSDFTTIAGSELVMECQVIGNPFPMITWHKDGTKILSENRMLQYVDRKVSFNIFAGICKLNIKNMDTKDGGEYSCEAVNSIGKDITRCRVQVTENMGSESRSASLARSKSSVIEVLLAPIIKRPLHDAIVIQGNRETLKVEVEAHPIPSVEWYLNGRLLNEKRTLRRFFDGRLAVMKIYEANEEHEGQYLCRIINKVGSAETRCTVIVRPPAGDDDHLSKMPKFLQKLQDTIVKNNEDHAILTCQIIGEPHPVVQWLFNGKAITDDTNIRIRSFDDNVCVLEVSRVTPKYCGIYTAVAHNIYGDAYSNAQLTISGQSHVAQSCTTFAPYFVVEPEKQLKIEEGADLEIAYNINSYPDPEVNWLKDGSVISNQRVSTKHDGINYKLLINSVNAQDAGRYEIQAKNSDGQIKGEILVEVSKGKKKKPAKVKVDVAKVPASVELLVKEVRVDNITLQWNEPKGDGGMKITEYKVEQRRPDERLWTIVNSVNGNEIVVRNLEPNTEYIFRVAAKTEVGWGEYSNSSIVKTNPLGKKPFFKNKWPDALSIEDLESFEICAEFDGDMEPTVKWYKNGIEIKESDNLKLIMDNQKKIAKLCVIKAISGLDDGVYSCYLQNDIGYASEKINVYISKKNEEGSSSKLFERNVTEKLDKLLKEIKTEVPEVLKHLVNEAVNIGQQFTLTCRITSQTNSQTTWFKNDERISSSGRFDLHSENGVHKLHCHNAQANDAATYKCFVTNTVGLAYSACEVSIFDLTSQTAPKFEKYLEEKTVIAGSNIELKCQVCGNPEPKIVWIKDGERITSSRRRKIAFKDHGICILTIGQCNSDDAGIYLCSAQNSLGVDSTQTILTVADVTGPDAHLVTADLKEKQYMKPKFTRAPATNVEVDQGASVKLISRAIGEPTPSVIWKKDGKEVKKNFKKFLHRYI